MKFAVTKEALLDGLQRIQNVVSTRSTLPVLTNALLETSKTGLRLTTTDLEVCVRCEVAAQVEKPGSTTLPARRLSAIVRSLTADKGYFAIEEIAQIQEFDIRTVIGDANAARRRKEVWPPRCAKLFIVPPVPSRATLAKRFCASAACTWNAALSTSSTKADCAEPPSREQKISLNATRSRRLALT